MTLALAIYRILHAARCLATEYCRPCDADRSDFYWASIAIDAYALGLATWGLYASATGGTCP